MPKTLGKDSTCSIARTLEVLGDAWTVLIVREAVVAGSRRFSQFRDALGIASNMLTARLAQLVDAGVFVRHGYQEVGARPRAEYILTDAGRSLSIVIDALATWGRTYRPRADGTSPRFAVEADGRAAHLAFVDDDGRGVDAAAVVASRAADAELAHVR